MVRTFLGVLLAGAGAAAAVRSPFLPWYGGRHGTGIRVDSLFTGTGVTPQDAALPGSLLLPMVFAGLLAMLGLLMRARYVVVPAGLLVLGTAVLWMVRQAQAAGSLTAGGDGLGTGVAYAVAGGLLLVWGGWLLHRPRTRRFARTAPAAFRPGPEPCGAAEPLPRDGGAGASALVGDAVLPLDDGPLADRYDGVPRTGGGKSDDAPPPYEAGPPYGTAHPYDATPPYGTAPALDDDAAPYRPEPPGPPS